MTSTNLDAGRPRDVHKIAPFEIKYYLLFSNLSL